jgi:RNA polymerase sigma factor (sigma-70 family)
MAPGDTSRSALRLGVIDRVSSSCVTRMLRRWQRCGVSAVSLEDAYERYADDLVRYAALLVPPSTAADVVADTFADLLLHADGAWSNARHPKGFLFGAVANRARMYHRQNARRRQRERRLVLATPQHSEGVVDQSSTESLEALAGLSVQQRAVTYLTYWQDFSVTQVAEMLSVSDGTVRRQLARSRSRLRGVLS